MQDSLPFAILSKRIQSRDALKTVGNLDPLEIKWRVKVFDHGLPMRPVLAFVHFNTTRSPIRQVRDRDGEDVAIDLNALENQLPLLPRHRTGAVRISLMYVQARPARDRAAGGSVSLTAHGTHRRAGRAARIARPAWSSHRRPRMAPRYGVKRSLRS